MSELVDYGQKCLDGVIDDPTFSATIYAAPPDADWLDEDVWRTCNPAIGAASAQSRRCVLPPRRHSVMPAREAVFRSLYLNQAVDTRSDKFIPIDEWLACQGDVDPEALRGRPCYLGLDLSSTQDLTACVAFFPEDQGAILAWFWALRDRLQERQDTDRAPYMTWHAQGMLEAPSGRAIDRHSIALRLGEIAAAYDVKAVAYDRHRIEDLLHVLTDDGIDLPLVPWGQGYVSMGPAIDALEAHILESHDMPCRPPDPDVECQQRRHHDGSGRRANSTRPGRSSGSTASSH